jgi:hypothetical protein
MEIGGLVKSYKKIIALFENICSDKTPPQEDWTYGDRTRLVKGRTFTIALWGCTRGGGRAKSGAYENV